MLRSVGQDRSRGVVDLVDDPGFPAPCRAQALQLATKGFACSLRIRSDRTQDRFDHRRSNFVCQTIDMTESLWGDLDLVTQGLEMVFQLEAFASRSFFAGSPKRGHQRIVSQDVYGFFE